MVSKLRENVKHWRYIWDQSPSDHISLNFPTTRTVGRGIDISLVLVYRRGDAYLRGENELERMRWWRLEDIIIILQTLMPRSPKVTEQELFTNDRNSTVADNRRRNTPHLGSHHNSIKRKSMILIVQRKPTPWLCVDLNITACSTGLWRGSHDSGYGSSKWNGKDSALGFSNADDVGCARTTVSWWCCATIHTCEGAVVNGYGDWKSSEGQRYFYHGECGEGYQNPRDDLKTSKDPVKKKEWVALNTLTGSGTASRLCGCSTLLDGKGGGSYDCEEGDERRDESLEIINIILELEGDWRDLRMDALSMGILKIVRNEDGRCWLALKSFKSYSNI